MSSVVHVGWHFNVDMIAKTRTPAEAVCITVGDVLDDDPRYLVVHTDTETIHIPHGRVIAIVEPKERS